MQLSSNHTEPGCSQCHRGITIGDWRDPLDPDLDAQVIFSQFHQGKSSIIKKYLSGEKFGFSLASHFSFAETFLNISTIPSPNSHNHFSIINYFIA